MHSGICRNTSSGWRRFLVLFHPGSSLLEESFRTGTPSKNTNKGANSTGCAALEERVRCTFFAESTCCARDSGKPITTLLSAVWRKSNASWGKSAARGRGRQPPYEALLRDPQNFWFEGPLLDAVGKLRGKPVYSLFGSAVRNGIDAYDGSLYFVDIASNRGAEAVGERAKEIKGDGYRAVKIKVGRPSKWLKGEAGVTRDTEAFIATREAVGATFNIMADANNGYAGHFDWAVRFLKDCSPYQMYWIEEIFPETVEDYRKLHRALLDANAVTPVRSSRPQTHGETPSEANKWSPLPPSWWETFTPPLTDVKPC